MAKARRNGKRAVQMDGDHNQQNFSLWVDQMQATAW